MKTTTILDRLTDIATELIELDGITEANPWTRKAGYERIYVELEGFNGRSPGRGVIEVHADGRVMYGRYHQWQGARTRRWHEDHDTIGRVREIVTRHTEEG